MLTDSFLDYIRKEKLFNEDDKLLLAISGGLDSVVLAHMLFQIGFKFSMAHMNFQLRGEDSRRDQAFVEELAHSYDVKCHIKVVEIEKNGNKQGASTQMQARELRYKWFAALFEEHQYTKILTAHHAEDSLETVLLNLSRGTGIKGLRGIKPAQADIVRPLLFSDKQQIMAYAEREKLKWREDISNRSDAYRRNELRHHVIPKLLKQNPNLFEGFNLTSLRLRAAEKAYEDKIAVLKAKYITEKASEIVIDKELLNLEFGIVYISEILKPLGFSLQQLNAFSFKNTGSRLDSESYSLFLDRESVIVSKRADQPSFHRSFSITDQQGEVRGEIADCNFSLRWEKVGRKEVSFSKGSHTVFLDYGLLQKPLILRRWEEGDKLQPLGMKANKKVSDILIDAKVPLPDKKRQLVLETAGDIVWLLNHRLSEKYKITEKTREIIKFEYEADNS